MIQLTEKAVKKIKDIAEAEGIGHLTVRVGVKGGGCAGFSQDMFFEDRPAKELDEKIEQDGITILIDPVSHQYMENTIIEWVDHLYGAGFKFLNPNVTGSCGCGSSVTF